MGFLGVPSSKEKNLLSFLSITNICEMNSNIGVVHQNWKFRIASSYRNPNPKISIIHVLIPCYELQIPFLFIVMGEFVLISAMFSHEIGF